MLRLLLVLWLLLALWLPLMLWLLLVLWLLPLVSSFVSTRRFLLDQTSSDQLRRKLYGGLISVPAMRGLSLDSIEPTASIALSSSSPCVFANSLKVFHEPCSPCTCSDSTVRQ